MSSLSNKSVRLAVRKHLTTDLRDPIDAHKLARARECRKVEPAIEYPDWRLEELGRKYAPVDAYEPNEVNE